MANNRTLRGQAVGGPQRTSALALSVLTLTSLSTHDLRSILVKYGAEVLLGLMVLLLAVMLIAVIRLPPYQSRAAEAGMDDEGTFGTTSPLTPVVASGSALAARARADEFGDDGPPAQRPAPGQAGYVPRHGQKSGDVGQKPDAVGLPKITGGPPWEPAPRPPDVWRS